MAIKTDGVSSKFSLQLMEQYTTTYLLFFLHLSDFRACHHQEIPPQKPINYMNSVERFFGSIMACPFLLPLSFSHHRLRLLCLVVLGSFLTLSLKLGFFDNAMYYTAGPTVPSGVSQRICPRFHLQLNPFLDRLDSSIGGP